MSLRGGRVCGNCAFERAGLLIRARIQTECILLAVVWAGVAHPDSEIAGFPAQALPRVRVLPGPVSAVEMSRFPYAAFDRNGEAKFASTPKAKEVSDLPKGPQYLS